MKLHRASNSASVTLGQLLGRGGEGSVHVVSGSPALVAKIYKKPPSPSKVDKLKAMARRHSSDLLRVAAWPVDLLIDEQGAVRGFLMGRIAARQDAHRLYSPKSRRRTFPDADFRFMVRAATNLARAFARVHVSGHVIGDVNHGNALIGRDGTAVLIDCDSFQISDHGRTFPCDVGSPLFTPPELQGRAFRGLRREATHDCFGLAVLLFHLLFQGRHPFAGKFADAEMTVERAIAESRFAYGARHQPLGTAPPPGTLALATFGDALANLFERAFAPPSDAVRPAAAKWIEPLERLEKAACLCSAAPDTSIRLGRAAAGARSRSSRERVCSNPRKQPTRTPTRRAALDDLRRGPSLLQQKQAEIDAARTDAAKALRKTHATLRRRLESE